MSIKFDGLSRIIDEFVDAVDSYGKRSRRCGSAAGLRTGGSFDAAMGHYAVQDDIAKIPSVGPAGKALPILRDNLIRNRAIAGRPAVGWTESPAR